MQASPGGHQFAQGLLDPSAAVPQDIKGQSARRYGVYRNNVTVGLVRAMEANFPVVCRLLGNEYFEGFAREFVREHPPRSPLMFEYGSEFPSFLEQAEDLGAYPYLGDVARLEQQVRLSHHEADAPCLSAATLARVPQEQLPEAIFKPHPAMAIVTSAFAVHDIYRANRNAASGTVENPGMAQVVLLTRPKYDVELRVLSSGVHAFMWSLAAGHPFEAAAGEAFDADENFDLAAALGQLLPSGAFQSINTKKVQP